MKLIRQSAAFNSHRSTNSLYSNFFSTFSQASQHFQALKAILNGDSSSVLKSNDDSFDKYVKDWTRSFSPPDNKSIVVLPRNTEDISKILSYCNQHTIGVVPHGGNTGLVGGAVPNADQVVISLERLRGVISLDEINGIVTCHAGTTLQALSDAVASKGFLVPLDLGAKGSCHIGGNVATNAGGMRVVKYGSMHSNVLGLEVVLANGDVLEYGIKVKMRKDNTGLHMKNLFIGSEGTLGIITKVCLQLAPLPAQTKLIWATVPSFHQLPIVKRRVCRDLGDVLSALEFMDSSSISAVREVYPQLEAAKLALGGGDEDEDVKKMGGSATGENKEEKGGGIEGEVNVLMECSLFDPDADDTRILTFLSKLIDENIILPNAYISTSATQESEMWKVRENVPVALMELSRRSGGGGGGKLFKYDVSLPIAVMSEFVSKVQKRVLIQTSILRDENTRKNLIMAKIVEDALSSLKFYTFGHAGDQNLHLNILLREIHLPLPLTPLSLLKDAGGGAGGGLGHISAGGDMYNLNTKEEIITSIQSILDDAVYGQVVEMGGSVSAEHGIGQLKKKLMHHIHSPAEMRMMEAVKGAFDPNGIMNPGKVF